MEEQKIRVMLVDDEPLAIRGLKLRLQEYPEIEIVGLTATAGNQALVDWVRGVIQ